MMGGTGVWDVGGFFDFFDLVDGLEFRGESSVHAEDAVVDERCDRQAVEAVDEEFPQLDVVPALAYIPTGLHSS